MTRHCSTYKVQWSIARRTIPRPCQVNTIFNTTIPLIEQVLEQLEMICSNRNEDLNKVSSIVGVNTVENVEIAEVTPKSICSIFSRSRSGIQSTQS